MSSDGDFSHLRQPTLFRQFAKELGERFERARYNSEVWDKVLRASGWLYLGIAEQCLNHLRRVAKDYVLRSGTEPMQTELHAMGLTFSELDDVRLFHRAFLTRFTGTVEKPNEWLRAMRNIVQFRDHALSDACVSSEVARRMVARIVDLLAYEAAHENVGQKFINCIRALPFMLKRRRYDPQFLKVSTDSVAKTLESLLQEIATPRTGLAHRLPDIHRRKPAATLRFLREEASMEDTVVISRA